jgi:ATP10 protein
MMMAKPFLGSLRNAMNHPSSTFQYLYPMKNIQFYSISLCRRKQMIGIQMNPNSIASRILSDGKTAQVPNDDSDKDRNSDNNNMNVIQTMQEKPLERAYGNFWMMQDLRKNGNKPILASKISSVDAELFPSLLNCNLLRTDNDNNNINLQQPNLKQQQPTSTSKQPVDLPSYFFRDNRTQDPSAQCTLVGIAFKDYGYKLLSSWLDPFEAEFGIRNRRAMTYRLSITEGWFTKLFLRRMIVRGFEKATPFEVQPQVLLSFGPKAEALFHFNNTLRMHNTLTGYVYLLDGLGNVRFAASGEATEDELKLLIESARELIPKLRDPNFSSKGRIKRSIKKYY